MHCPNCKVPIYTASCPYCLAKARDAAEKASPIPPAPNVPPRALLQPQNEYQETPLQGPPAGILNIGDYPRWRTLHGMLQGLWSASVTTPNYDRRAWFEFEHALRELATSGLGAKDPPTASDEVTTPMAVIPEALRST